MIAWIRRGKEIDYPFIHVLFGAVTPHSDKKGIWWLNVSSAVIVLLQSELLKLFS